jgi:hypothetical protein
MEPNMPQNSPFDYGRKIQTEALPKSGTLSIFGRLFQSPLGPPRQFIVIGGDSPHHFLGFFIGHLIGDGASLFGAVAPMLRIVDGDWGHCCNLLQDLFMLGTVPHKRTTQSTDLSRLQCKSTAPC